MLVEICFQKMERFDWINEFCSYFFKAPKESITQLSILRVRQFSWNVSL